MQQQPVLYDFATALSRLQERIQVLIDTKQQATTPPSRLGTAWAFVKANRGNAFLLMVFYSMSAASVVGGIMSDHRLQSDRMLETREQQRLMQHITRLESQVQQQQQLLDGLTSDLQQHSSSSNSWRAAGAVRQQMMQRLQQWRHGPQEAAGGLAEAKGSSTGTGHADDQHPGQQESFGIKVGHLGQGFLI